MAHTSDPIQEAPRNGTVFRPVGATMHTLDRASAEETAVICHELRNSLAVLRGAARLLRSSAASRQIDTARSVIERHVGQMSRHIADLLGPTHHEGSVRGLQLSKVDLRETARDAIDAVGPEMALRRHRLTVRLSEAPVWVHADGARLEQALANLLNNAAKYTPDGGDIALAMESVGDRAYLRVRDSGVGIEPAMLPRVFGMFVQVDRKSRSAHDGRGIGLAVVRNLVELHGGAVSAASAGVGSGSEFTIVLPLL